MPRGGICIHPPSSSFSSSCSHDFLISARGWRMEGEGKTLLKFESPVSVRGKKRRGKKGRRKTCFLPEKSYCSVLLNYILQKSFLLWFFFRKDINSIISFLLREGHKSRRLIGAAAAARKGFGWRDAPRRQRIRTRRTQCEREAPLQCSGIGCLK